MKYARRKDVSLTDTTDPLLSIEDSSSHAVITFEDPQVVSNELHDMYKSISDACVDTYLLKLQNLKMFQGERAMSCVNRMVEMENELAAIGHSPSEKGNKHTLLRGLIEEFSVTVGVI